MIIKIRKNVKKGHTHSSFIIWRTVLCHFQWVMRPASHTNTFAGLLSLTRSLQKQPDVWRCYGSHVVEKREGVKTDTVMDQTAWPLKMGLIGCPNTLTNNYQPTPCNIQTFNFVNSYIVTDSSTKCVEMDDVIYSTMFMFGMYVGQNSASTGCLCFRFSPKSSSVHCRFQATVMWHHEDWYTDNSILLKTVAFIFRMVYYFKTCIKSGYNIGEGQDKWTELWTNISGETQYSEQLNTSTL
jgi:hypothetical protein